MYFQHLQALPDVCDQAKEYDARKDRGQHMAWVVFVVADHFVIGTHFEND